MRISLQTCRWAAFFFVASLAPLAMAADNPSARLKEHLASGEFAPALTLARQAPMGPQRDAMLGDIAAAQAAIGGSSSALNTASMIDGDLTRNRAVGQAAAGPVGGFGGGSQANFQPLIDLITATVAPTSWDTVGGPGAIAPFATGVWVDAEGTMHRWLENDKTNAISRLREEASHGSAATSARRTSALRKVSLPRLERALQLAVAQGKQPTEEMALLAGLQKIQYVLVYPESNDVVLAGPAGDWQLDREGRPVNVETGRPVLQLDDLIVVLRHMTGQPKATFGCSIKPVQASLARTKTFLEESSKTPLKAGGRTAWLGQLQKALGSQDIEYYGIDPRTRVAQVLLEADYRMKLVGIGLEEGTLGVPSYLSMIKVGKDEAPPSLGVLRWWFTLNYQALVTNAPRDAFELRGQGVQVQSENEALAANGERIHTGESDPLNSEFARNFTTHFAALAQKYPVYADMQNIFDLAMVGALIKSEKLDSRADWHQTCFNDAAQYQVARAFAPKQVQSVINHRVVNRTQILAAVSGGVYIDPTELVKPSAIQADKSGTLGSYRAGSAPEKRPRDNWWWD